MCIMDWAKSSYKLHVMINRKVMGYQSTHSNFHTYLRYDITNNNIQQQQLNCCITYTYPMTIKI